ncbi:MAG: 5-formyltetrahydrofolate cyclo-ligase [Rhodobacterales bacterium]|nr:MAG: 5-formyltetrahydrofolate cyclo-ligase [Rhodobacterales bacterium]
MAISDKKAACRAEGIAARGRAPVGAQEAAAGHLSSVLAGHRGVPLAGYMAMRGEVDPQPAMEEASAYGPVGVPVIEQKAAPLKFRSWEPGCPLVRGTFGAMIPQDGTWIVPQIVIVPLVAWDARGGRLGYGGGFYDRTLEALRVQGAVMAVGFAFAAQEVAEVPIEETDQPLDLMVTDAGVIRF